MLQVGELEQLSLYGRVARNYLPDFNNYKLIDAGYVIL
jgi:hypothetical protein